MRTPKTLLGIAMSFLMLCSVTGQKITTTAEAENLEHQEWLNPLNPEVPAATVKRIKATPREFLRTDECSQALSPAHHTDTAEIGGISLENKTACIDGVPPKGDVLFCFDLTGSMGQELNNLKANSANIMTSLAGSLDDVAYGLISHMDYTQTYSSCGYSAPYGGASSGDYPYSMDQAITSDQNLVETAINSLTLGWGSDFPESYERALYETVNDDAIGWRDDAARIVVAWLDAVPHDCAGVPGYRSTTGSDPGRDEIMGNADDIDMDDAVQDMIDENIRLIVLYSGVNSTALTDYWTDKAESTGGLFVQINSDGSIPSGISIDQFIVDIIEESFATLDKLSLRANPSSFDSWIASISPAEYTNITLDIQQEFDFDIEFQIPDGTANGDYDFEVELVGDGVVYGSQTVSLTVSDNCPDVSNPDQADSDGDGTGDACDDCPEDPDKTAQGVCGCGVADVDSDGDGTLDCNDGCPTDPAKIDPGLCGCGVADTDTDLDGTPDCDDDCPEDPMKIDSGQCGCGEADTDSDGDGTADCIDDCPDDPDKIEEGICGCGVSDDDSDGDGVADCDDICEGGDDALDADCDGVPDFCDECPGGDDSIDNNGDGLPDCAYPPSYDLIEESWKCGRNKVYMCHLRGNGDRHTICVNKNSIDAHIAHGDYLGPCDNSSCDEFDSETEDRSVMVSTNHPELHVYPVPADEFVILDLGFSTDVMFVEIFNSFGTLQYQTSTSESILKINLDESTIGSGIHIVRVQSGETTMTQKFIVR